MKYLIVFIMCCLATAKVSMQSAFSKKSINNIADTLFFNGLVFAFSAILFLNKVIACSGEIWLYAVAFASFTVLFQVSYTKALSVGNVSLSVLLVNLSMIIPVLVSFLVYKEPLSPIRLIGIVLTLIALLISVDFKFEKSSDKTWFLFAVFAMLSNGGIAIVQKVFGSTELKAQMQAFVSCSYIVATIITFTIYVFINKTGTHKTFKTDKTVIVYVLFIGIVLAIFQAINTYAISTIDGTFLFPAYSGGSTVFSAISGRLIFKDKLTPKQKVSLLIGIIAVIIMNF